MITNTYSVQGSIQLVEPTTNSTITLHAGDTFKHELADDGTSTILHKEKSYRFDKMYTRAIESVLDRTPQIFEKTLVEDDQDDDMDLHWGYKLADLVARLNSDGVEIVAVSATQASREDVEHYLFSIKVNGLLNNLQFDENYTEENYKENLARCGTVLIRNNEPGSPEWLRGRDMLNRIY